MKIDKIFICLTAVFIVSVFLRTYQLRNIPHGLHNDEVVNTYIGRYILTNGRDLHGVKLPLLYFNKFGDYPPVLPMYLSGLGTLIFGNNEFGSRIIIAIIGAFIIVPVYFIAMSIFKDAKLALFASALTAIAPWQIVLSRVNAENVIATTVYAFGLVFFIEGMDKKTVRQVIIGYLLFLLTFFVYPAFRIIGPLTLMVGLILVDKKLWNKPFFYFIIVMIIISAGLTLFISTTVWGKGRFNQTSIFNPNSGVVIRNQELIFNESNIISARIFNNKAVAYSKEFVSQYFKYFDPNFLFGTAGLPKVYAVPNNGLLYLTYLVLLLFAFIPVTNDQQLEIKNLLFMMAVLAIIPVATALTIVDVPNVHRSLPMIIPMVIFTVYGFHNLTRLHIKGLKVFLSLLLLFLLLEFIYFFHNYFQHASMYQSLWRNDGNKELVEYILANRKKFNKVYVTDEQRWLPIYYLFYKNDYDIKYVGRFKNDFYIDSIDNLIFPHIPCPTDRIIQEIKKTGNLQKFQNVLIVDREGCGSNPTFFRRVDVIKRIGGTTAFEISKFDIEALLMTKKTDEQHR